MARIIYSLLFLLLSFQCSFGKAVDENTAQTVAANFCKTKDWALPSAPLLAYRATSVVKGAAVTDFYVFNIGTTGFVIVSGDDNIAPVLAYSNESAFDAHTVPENVSGWLSNYKDQVNYVIANGITSTHAAANWNQLQQPSTGRGAKTTYAGVVGPLLKTYWNQAPYYNALCPYDAGAHANTVTGCVATAMAQVMKYWNWPRRGVGSHTYNSSYGVLTADFGHTVFQWDSMKTSVSTVDTSIAVLMFEAGVSVNMSYSPTESGAFVNTNASPITNCAQYALQTYFSYNSSTLQGVYRSGYSDSDWVHLIKAEIDGGRPAIYTGDGSSGGHCWVADGYETADRIHFNWGWGGNCNGYYYVENLVPGGTDFNSNHTLMTGIEPDSTVIAAVNEVTANENSANIYPNPAVSTVNIDLGKTGTKTIRIIDIAGREVSRQNIPGNTTNISIPVGKLAEGMYLVELQTASGILTRKITIAR